MNQWENIPTLSMLLKFDFVTAEYQPLWYLVNAIAKSIYNDFTSFQIIHAAFVNISIFITIKRYSEYRFSAVLVYFLMSFLYFNCEILRESMALAVFLFALPALMNKKWIKYYGLVTVCFLIHKSSLFLFFLPLLRPVFKKEMSIKTLLYICAVLFIVFNPYIQQLFVLRFFPFLEQSVAKYGVLKYSINGSIVAITKCLILYLLLYIRQRHNVYNATVDIGLKFYFFLCFLSMFSPMAGIRWSNYFNIFFLIALVDVFWKFRKCEFVKKNVIIVFFLLHTIYYYGRDVSDWTGIKGTKFGEIFYPYSSVFEDVPKDVLYRRTAIYLQENSKE